jgi:1-acyl-sn-glycerol-3-phosphate acyltransferase
MSVGTFSREAGDLLMRWLRDYHHHRVFGFENVPKTGAALLAFHHSLCTYDSFLLSVPIRDELQREFKGLADRLIFKTPVLGKIFKDAGFIVGTRDGTLEMLKAGELVGMAPGGMRESLRPSRDRYQFDWSGRQGFVRVAMEAGVPIVLGACPKSDDIYRVAKNPVTPFIYQRFKLPVPLALGRWGTALPRPVKLWHLMSEPLRSDVAPDQLTDRDVEAMHAKVVARMQRLMKDALALEGAR